MSSVARAAFLLLVGATLSLSVGGCPTQTDTQTPSDLTGNAAAGQAIFAQRCASCHSARGLSGREGRITNNMGSVLSAMRGITLTDQEVVELQAFIASQ
ncbi:MAG: cytochrome c [Phycisphaerae bacterium]